MSGKRKSAKMQRLGELSVMLAGVALLASFGVSKIQEYRKPKNPALQQVKKAIDATKRAAVTVTSEAPRSLVSFITHPVETIEKADRDALQELDKKIEQDPTDTKSIYKRFRSHQMNLRTEEAQTDLARLIELKDPYLTAAEYNERAYYQAKTEGDFTGALSSAEFAARELPDKTHVQDTLAYIYVGLGRDLEAIHLYNKILSTNPDSLRALWGRGAAYRRMGNSGLASVDFDEAAKIDPDFCLHWSVDPDPGKHRE